MPTQAQIKPKVLKKISAVTDVPTTKIKETSRLDRDLGMGAAMRYAMGQVYSRISTSYAGGKPVSMAKAKSLKTVKQSIDLVTKKANGK